jgi:signal transduction histidine kinase
MASMAAGVCVSVAILTWYGYHAIREWQRSSTLLASRRADEAAERLVTALTRDMRGVQDLVLSSPHSNEFMLDPPYDLSNLVASAFARYPYPESFFSWRNAANPDAVLFFNRSDRPPPWMPGPAHPTPFPVTVATQHDAASRFLARIGRDVAASQRFSIFELQLDGVSYQVVSRLLYRDPFREQLEGVFGFTVNLPWVRSHYFPELASQVAHIGTIGAGLDLAVIDDGGRLVTRTQPDVRTGSANQRPFALMFFDPRLVLLNPPPDLPNRTWLVQVAVARDPTLLAAINGADRTLIVSALAAVSLAVGLVLTGRAARQSARLAEMRSEFVSTVTHELKTPIATIRAAGDTLVSGRIATPEASREYAQMVVQEAKRLTRLVDNLLAYARVTDIADIYFFEATQVDALVSEALDSSHAHLMAARFDVDVDIPGTLPAVRVDRMAIELLLDNLIDNAIRYSTDHHALSIRARARPDFVDIAIIDRGSGIPADEIGRVTRKFVRGRRAVSGGSGLGLAIATRIASDHGGSIAIVSQLDEGTTVTVTLPIAGEGI